MIPRLRGRGAAVAALIGYGLLTLVMTYPLIRRFTSAIPGDGFDGWQNYWNLWWVRQALLVEHAHPWFTDMLYAPVGVSLLFHTLNLFNGLATLPIQLAWGLFPTYNSAVLFSFAMSGLGAYLLARYVLGPRSSRLAAFAAGIIFTFSPFHIAHLLGHMQVMSMEWVPFFALYLLRTVGSESANQQISKSANQQINKRANHASRFTHHASRTTRHNLLLAILFLVLVALCDWYYVLYCLIFTAVVFVWIGVRAWRARRAAKPRDEGRPSAPTAARHLVRIALAMAVIWLVWSALLSPVLAPMIREARDYSFMVPNAEDSRRYSADLLAFVVPQQFHPLWGRIIAALKPVALSRHGVGVSGIRRFHGAGGGADRHVERVAWRRGVAESYRRAARPFPAPLALGRARVLRVGARPGAAHRRTDRAAAGRPRDPAALRGAGARGAVHEHQPLGEPL